MASARVRGIKRPTVPENDHPETQSKSRCRSPSHIRESPSRRASCQQHPNSGNNASAINLSSKSSGTNAKTSNSTGTSSATSKDSSGKASSACNGANSDGHNNCSKWCEVRRSSRKGICDQYTNAFDVEIPLPVVEYCRAYLGSPGIRLFLEQTKDKDNWHPWVSFHGTI